MSMTRKCQQWAQGISVGKSWPLDYRTSAMIAENKDPELKDADVKVGSEGRGSILFQLRIKHIGAI